MYTFQQRSHAAQGAATGLLRRSLPPRTRAAPEYSRQGLSQPSGAGISLTAPGPAIQRKASISACNDPLEHEADNVADRVMRMAEPAPIGAAATSIQRRCAACEEDDKQKIQAKRTTSASAAPAFDTGTATRAAARGGAPLSSELRSFFEPRFGHDFSNVRVQFGSAAADAARSVQARAFTLGNVIVFGSGQYAPATEHGKRLLAHELTHVVQQSNANLRQVAAQGERAARRNISAGSASVIMRDPKENPAEILPAPQATQNRDCGAPSTQSFAAQPEALRAAIRNSHGGNAEAWFDKLGGMRSILTSLYTRLCNYGLWDLVTGVGEVYPGEKRFIGFEVPGASGHVDFTADAHTLMRNTLGTSRFCADVGIGGSQHKDQASFREVGNSDSLHLAVGPGTHFDAHIDRYSPVVGGGGAACIYDPKAAAAHIGRELVPEKVRSKIGIPGVQVFPEPVDPNASPSILGMTLRF